MSGKRDDKRGTPPREDPAKARERFERQSAALRENLRRRKAQQQRRQRPDRDSGDDGEGTDRS